MFMPSASGFQYVVAARDDLTGWCEAKVLRKNNAKALAKFFYEQIYCRHGIVLHVTTNNRSEVKATFTELLKRLKIHQIRISLYNLKMATSLSGNQQSKHAKGKFLDGGLC
jgi:hypothetical protein